MQSDVRNFLSWNVPSKRLPTSGYSGVSPVAQGLCRTTDRRWVGRWLELEVLVVATA
jgi:hypothetical protein